MERGGNAAEASDGAFRSAQAESACADADILQSDAQRRKARCRRCHAERIARLKRMRQKRDERNCRRPERHVQPREMPGNKADGAVMVLQTRRTRHRRQSNDWRAWRGQSECGASIAAKRRPAFSADSKHSTPTQHSILYGKAIRRQVLYSHDRAPNAASPFGRPVQHLPAHHHAERAIS